MLENIHYRLITIWLYRIIQIVNVTAFYIWHESCMNSIVSANKNRFRNDLILLKKNFICKVDKNMGNRKEEVFKITLPTPYPVGDINVFVVKGDALTLFDTGCKTKESKDVLEKGLQEIGLHLNDIDQIILTHHHLDHYDGLDFFEKDVPVYGHQNNQRWLQITDEFLSQHNQFFLRIC